MTKNKEHGESSSICSVLMNLTDLGRYASATYGLSQLNSEKGKISHIFYSGVAYSAFSVLRNVFYDIDHFSKLFGKKNRKSKDLESQVDDSKESL